ncbi:hypothetical protein Hdeb2414_s0033g00724191 [Helianthus debilis subsp. tardiflorus]
MLVANWSLILPPPYAGHKFWLQLPSFLVVSQYNSIHGEEEKRINSKIHTI